MVPTSFYGADRPCYVRTASLITTDQARAPQVRHASPSYFEVLYLFQYFPRLSPPPSGFNLGRVIRRVDRIVTVVQSVGLIVELPLMTHGFPRPEDVDRKDSRTDTSQLIPGFPTATFAMVLCLSALIGYYLAVAHARTSLL